MKDSDQKPSVEELTRQIARLQAELQALEGQTNATAYIEGGVKVNKGNAIVGTKIDTVNIRYGMASTRAKRHAVPPRPARSISA